ncbi:methionine ABC transporter ATP-binding protein [Paraburkholderia sp. DHOC27]|uniref:methionine ABC transporter ATP-binding protein n=1 Tax=Paraburkholderia sp. DHOC27 TaxID=2303330 RepID=UPI000E3C355E|nr:ATP-binding cassette domain-containing protein [Paraburkholderia sp. DHOC27]RFU49289.1 ATP-binding cassette domain-containing protein [Paraburkholderia sp. DHOC27]
MISIRELSKRYVGKSGAPVEVLRGINLEVPDRTITAVIGPSGAGKTTLSKCISLLEKPSSGSVLVNGKDLSSLGAAQLRHERRAIGTIFQASALLERRTAAENVALPLEYLGVVRRDIERRVAELLEHVGLADKAHLYPAQLSGGQRQRVGIARALALHPQVLLSDEATSGLDPQATESILALLRQLRDEFNLSIILITHEMDVVRTVADNVAVLRAGQIVETGSVSSLVGDPDSQIGRQLLPIRFAANGAADAMSFEVRYATQRDVPEDWISLLGDALQARVRLRSGIVEDIHGRRAGRAQIGLAFLPGANADAGRAIRVMASLGLYAIRLDEPNQAVAQIAEPAALESGRVYEQA